MLAVIAFAASVVLETVSVPVAAPILMVVAAPPMFSVVAVVLASAKVVEGVVSAVVTAMPNTKGTEAVVACVPSFRTAVVNAVAKSLSVLFAHVELIVVPVTTGFNAGSV